MPLSSLLLSHLWSNVVANKVPCVDDRNRNLIRSLCLDQGPFFYHWCGVQNFLHHWKFIQYVRETYGKDSVVGITLKQFFYPDLNGLIPRDETIFYIILDPETPESIEYFAQASRDRLRKKNTSEMPLISIRAVWITRDQYRMSWRQMAMIDEQLHPALERIEMISDTRIREMTFDAMDVLLCVKTDTQLEQQDQKIRFRVLMHCPVVYHSLISKCFLTASSQKAAEELAKHPVHLLKEISYVLQIPDLFLQFLKKAKTFRPTSSSSASASTISEPESEPESESESPDNCCSRTMHNYEYLKVLHCAFQEPLINPVRILLVAIVFPSIDSTSTLDHYMCLWHSSDPDLKKEDWFCSHWNPSTGSPETICLDSTEFERNVEMLLEYDSVESDCISKLYAKICGFPLPTTATTTETTTTVVSGPLLFTKAIELKTTKKAFLNGILFYLAEVINSYAFICASNAKNNEKKE
jgi:hypothetical protein